MANLAAQQIIDTIESFATEAINQGDPQVFLELLSGENGLHFVWHFRGLRQSYGFLLFHWRLVDKVNQFFNPRSLTTADFSPGGTYYARHTDWNRVGPNLLPAKSLDDLANFSQYLETWHNLVHGVLTQVSGLPMGDGAVNIKYPLFWQFHRFINDLFERQLQSYANASGIHSSTFLQIIENIESQPPIITGSI